MPSREGPELGSELHLSDSKIHALNFQSGLSAFVWIWGHGKIVLYFRDKNLNCSDRPGFKSEACCLLTRGARASHLIFLSLGFLICQMRLSTPSLRGQSGAHRWGSEHYRLPHPVPRPVPGCLFLQLISLRTPLWQESRWKVAGAELDLRLGKGCCLFSYKIFTGID